MSAAEGGFLGGAHSTKGHPREGMIVQILADAGKVGNYRHTVFAQLCCGADPRHHDQLWRADRPRTHDDFAFCIDVVALAVFRVPDTTTTRTVHHQLAHECVGHDGEI